MPPTLAVMPLVALSVFLSSIAPLTFMSPCTVSAALGGVASPLLMATTTLTVAAESPAVPSPRCAHG